MTIERIRKISLYFGVAALLLFFIAWSLVKFDALGFNGNQIKYSAQSGEIIPVEFNIKFDESDEVPGQLPNNSDFTNTSENIDGGGSQSSEVNVTSSGDKTNSADDAAIEDATRSQNRYYALIYLGQQLDNDSYIGVAYNPSNISEPNDYKIPDDKLQWVVDDETNQAYLSIESNNGSIYSFQEEKTNFGEVYYWAEVTEILSPDSFELPFYSSLSQQKVDHIVWALASSKDAALQSARDAHPDVEIKEAEVTDEIAEGVIQVIQLQWIDNPNEEDASAGQEVPSGDISDNGQQNSKIEDGIADFLAADDMDVRSDEEKENTIIKNIVASSDDSQIASQLEELIEAGEVEGNDLDTLNAADPVFSPYFMANGQMARVRQAPARAPAVESSGDNDVLVEVEWSAAPTEQQIRVPYRSSIGNSHSSLYANLYITVNGNTTISPKDLKVKIPAHLFTSDNARAGITENYMSADGKIFGFPSVDSGENRLGFACEFDGGDIVLTNVSELAPNTEFTFPLWYGNAQSYSSLDTGAIKDSDIFYFLKDGSTIILQPTWIIESSGASGSSNQITATVDTTIGTTSVHKGVMVDTSQFGGFVYPTSLSDTEKNLLGLQSSESGLGYRIFWKIYVRTYNSSQPADIVISEQDPSPGAIVAVHAVDEAKFNSSINLAKTDDLTWRDYGTIGDKAYVVEAVYPLDYLEQISHFTAGGGDGLTP